MEVEDLCPTGGRWRFRLGALGRPESAVVNISEDSKCAGERIDS